MRRGYLFGLIVIALILALVGTTLFTPSRPADTDTVDPGLPVNEPSGDNEAEADIRTATLVAVGDIMGHETQVVQAKTVSADGSPLYDFKPSFDIIAPYLMEPDITVGNLETTLAGPERGYSYFPNFNTPVELAANLKDVGFDLLATANNHSLDTGLSGLRATLENVRSEGLQAFGTYLNHEERDTPVIVEVNGIKIAFIAYTFSTNQIPVPVGHEYAVNLAPDFRDISPVTADIQNARSAGADVVAVFPHWGPMYVFEPPQHLRDVARELAEAGADLILGNHAHVIQPMEWITVSEGERAGRRVLVAYSMGNFLTNQHYAPQFNIPTPDVKCGLLVQVEFKKDMLSGVTVISEADYEITWVHRHWRHRILPSSEVLSRGPEPYNLSEADFIKLQTSYTRMKEIVEKYDFSVHKQ